MPSNPLNPMAKAFWSITQITNQELEEAQDILSIHLKQFNYPPSPELPDSGFVSAGLCSPFNTQEASPILAHDTTIFVRRSPTEAQKASPILADDTIALACPSIEATSRDEQTQDSEALFPIGDYLPHNEPGYVAWVQNIRMEVAARKAPPRYDRKLLQAELSAEYQRFSSIQDRLRFLGIDSSPFLPKSFSEYLYLRERGIEAKRIQLQHKIKNMEYSRKVTMPCFGGRDFAFGRSAVLSEGDIWGRPAVVAAAVVSGPL